MSGLRFDRYAVSSGWESLLRHGPTDRPAVLIVLPLFHEHDRLRRFAGSLMRALARFDIATACADRPGENESLRPLPSGLEAWHASTKAAASATHAFATISIRTGALLDGAMPPERRYRFAPATGGALVRDLRRAAGLALAERGGAAGAGGGIDFGGRTIPADLVDQLALAEPPAEVARTLRLEGDARPADARVAGELLWRRAESGDDPQLAGTIAADFVDWGRACAAI